MEIMAFQLFVALISFAAVILIYFRKIKDVKKKETIWMAAFILLILIGLISILGMFVVFMSSFIQETSGALLT